MQASTSSFTFESHQHFRTGGVGTGTSTNSRESAVKKKKRVRTGCLACRVRRVRCIEGEKSPSGLKKPCKWCEGKGIECRYPSAPVVLPRKHTTEKDESPPLDDSTSEEATPETDVSRTSVESIVESVWAASSGSGSGSGSSLSSSPSATTTPQTTSASPPPQSPTPKENHLALLNSKASNVVTAISAGRSTLQTSFGPIISIPRSMKSAHFHSSSSPLELELLFNFYGSFSLDGPDFMPGGGFSTRVEHHLLLFLDYCFTTPSRNVDLQLYVYYATLSLSAAHRVWRGGPAAPMYQEACVDLATKARAALADARKGVVPIDGDDNLVIGSFLLNGADIFMFKPLEIEVTPYDMIPSGLPTAKSTMVHGAHDIIAATSTLIALCDPCEAETPAPPISLTSVLDDFSFSDSAFDPSNSAFVASVPSSPIAPPPSKILPLSLSDSPLIPILFGANRRIFAVMQKVVELTRRNLILHASGTLDLNRHPESGTLLMDLRTEAMLLLFEVGVGWFPSAGDFVEPCTSDYVELGTCMFRRMLEVLLLAEVLQVPFSDWRVHDALTGMLETAAQFDRPLQKEVFPLAFLIGACYCIDVEQRQKFRVALELIGSVFGLAPDSYFGSRVAMHCWKQVDMAQRHYRILPWRKKLSSLGMNIVV
ncbi:hypothetical protein T439DRAFT_320234 [Meredithblackwellia eburnea MCA 4105]